MTVRRPPLPSLPHNMGEGEGGGPRQARGAAREGGILEQDVDRLSGEPACLDAGPSASRCVATALTRSSALCMIVARRKNTVDSDFRLRDCSRSARE